MKPGLRIVPITLRQARDFVDLHHRHHESPHAHRFSLGVKLDEQLVGVAICGRPKARKLPQYDVAEAVRVCTDGTRNACSKLYGAVCRVCREWGFDYAMTYILESESGASLRAAGWKPEAVTDGGSWDRDGRPRQDKHPTEPKVRYVCPCRASK